MKKFLFAFAVVVATPVLAQNAVVVNPETTGSLGPVVVQPGGPDIANSGPASTGEIAPFGSPENRISNNPAGDSNAELTTRPLPNLGKGGGTSDMGG